MAEPINKIDERLIELTTENEQLKLKIATLEGEKEALQIDFSNQLAKKTIEVETIEMELKRKIRDLTKALEMRANNKDKLREKDEEKSVGDIWDSMLGNKL